MGSTRRRLPAFLQSRSTTRIPTHQTRAGCRSTRYSSRENEQVWTELALRQEWGQAQAQLLEIARPTILGHPLSVVSYLRGHAASHTQHFQRLFELKFPQSPCADACTIRQRLHLI